MTLIESERLREALEAAREALEQSNCCIRGEAPEDVSFGEAEDDTYSKNREALAKIESALATYGEQDRVTDK